MLQKFLLFIRNIEWVRHLLAGGDWGEHSFAEQQIARGTRSVLSVQSEIHDAGYGMSTSRLLAA